MNPISIARKSTWIKAKAEELGFTACGIAQADFLEKEASDLEKWLKQGRHGEMAWMENHFDLRTDPKKIVPGAKSVISLTLNYFPEEERKGKYKFSKYAYGRDYHKVLKKKCKVLLNAMQSEFGEIDGRAFVDSAPVMDKAWAQKAGLGWVGKHTNLLNKHQGSFFFIAEIICDLELEYDQPVADHCGTCTKCLDACPTDALTAPYEIDGSKCISYYTIELKEQIPEEVKGNFENWVFGCDICQDVCPWNTKSTPHSTPEFQINEQFNGLSDRDLEEITEEVFDKTFTGSAIKRTKIEGLKRNILFVQD